MTDDQVVKPIASSLVVLAVAGQESFQAVVSWSNTAWLCRSAHRYWNESRFSGMYVGFRVVLVSP